jgi:glutaredoxin
MTFVEAIRNSIRPSSLSLELIIHTPAEESEMSDALCEIAAVVQEAGGAGVAVRRGGTGECVGKTGGRDGGVGGEVPDTPALTFLHPGSGSITYMALPDGQETAPFIEMLAWKPGETGQLPRHTRAALCRLARPARVYVFTTSECPHCPHAVRAANTLALLSPDVTTTIIDVPAFPKLAERFNIRSVPMTVVDEELFINRVVTAGKLADNILSRDDGGFAAHALLSQVETGNIDTASRRLSGGGTGADAFLSAWKASSLSSRMGLMLAAKQSLQEKPDVLDAIVNGLIGLLGTGDLPMRGDTADLLGQIGHESARGPLEALLGDQDADIVEIAEEALEHLSRGES